MEVAIFASGNGTNFEVLAKEKYKNIHIALLVCNNPDAYVIKRAINLGIPYVVINHRDYKNDKEGYEMEILKHLKAYNIEFIALAGYMRIVGDVLLNNYEGRMINIHPALLPSFKGAHGIEDAYNFGVKVMGVTVHYVSSELDGGKIIDQDSFYVGDLSLEEAEAEIHKIEYKLYPKVLKNLLEEK